MKAIDAVSQIEQLVKLALENRDIQTKGIPRSIRLPEAIDSQINKAMEILGCDRTEIVVACLEKHASTTITDLIQKRHDDAIAYLKSGAGPLNPGSRRNHATPPQEKAPLKGRKN